MANIITQLRSGQADVHHRGYDLKEVKFPDYVVRAAELAYDEEKLTEVLKDEGILLNMLHLGMSEYVVKWRANVRPSDTSEKPKQIYEEEDDARSRGRYFVPSLLPNPDEAKTTKGTSKALAEHNRKLVVSMAQVGVTWEQTAEALAKTGVDVEEYKSIYDRALEG